MKVGEHVVVVSHRPRPEAWHLEASFHFVDGVEAAVVKVQQLAGDRTVGASAGEVGGQVLAAGLVDEVAMDIVPVVFGSGQRAEFDDDRDRRAATRIFIPHAVPDPTIERVEKRPSRSTSK